MKTIDQQRSTLPKPDRQRKLSRQSILRIILVSSFIANLLIVYKLIHPAPAGGLVNTVSFASLAPLLRGSVLFFLALSVASLIGFACLDPMTDQSTVIIQQEPVEMAVASPVAEPAQLIFLRTDLSQSAIEKRATLVRE